MSRIAKQSQHTKNRKKQILRQFLVLFVPLSLLILAILFFYFYITQQNEKNFSITSEATLLEMQERFIFQDINPVITDLHVLSGHHEISHLVEKLDKESLSALEAEFIVFASQKKVYDQVRLLDATGKELIRINYNDKTSKGVAAQKLQNKGLRYYFRPLLDMGEGEVYISPLDLNMEFGKIEQPEKPVLRLAKVILSKDQKRRYYLVVNYLGENFFRKFQDLPQENKGRVMLLNSKGYWLYGGGEYNWAFMYPDRVNQSFQHKQPEVWAKLNQSQSGQILTDEGLYSFKSIYPLSGKVSTRYEGASSFDQNESFIKKEDFYWKLVRFLPIEVLSQETNLLKARLFTIFFVLEISAVLFSLVYAQQSVKKRLLLDKLVGQNYHYSTILSQTQDEVFQRTITPSYILALGFIIILLIADNLGHEFTSSTQETSAAVVNVSGRQRMLSQRVALFSQEFLNTKDSDKKRVIGIQLLEAVKLMKTSHNGLVYGDQKLNLPGYQTEEVRKMYFAPPINLNKQVTQYIQRAENILALPPEKHSANHPDLQYILQQGPNRLLSSLDILVRQYQTNSETDLQDQEFREYTLLAITILLIILIAFFIFRPMARKVQEEANKLIRLEQHQRTILGNIQDGLLLVNSDTTIDYCNLKASEIFKISQVKMLGKTFFNLIYNEEEQDLSLQAMSHSNEVILNGKRSSGDKFPLELIVSDFIFEDQKLYLVVIRDVTERKLLHDTLELKQELEVANQTKNRFFSIIAHDLRSPFNALLNLSEFLLDDVETQSRVDLKTSIQALHSSINNTYNLLEQLLLWANAQSNKMIVQIETLNLHEILQSVLDKNATALDEKGLQLKMELPEDITVKADQKMLETVLHNLVTNAIKFSYPMGPLYIRGEVTDGRLLSLLVQDEGMGIPVEIQEDLFRLDKSTSTNGTQGEKGTGLGLILCKDMMEQMDGSVEFTPTSGPGAAFTLHFSSKKGKPNE